MTSAQPHTNQLKFPSNRSIKNAKKDAKKLSVAEGITLTEAQNRVSRENGLEMNWDKAIDAIKTSHASMIHSIDDLAEHLEVEQHNHIPLILARDSMVPAMHSMDNDIVFSITVANTKEQPEPCKVKFPCTSLAIEQALDRLYAQTNTVQRKISSTFYKVKAGRLLFTLEVTNKNVINSLIAFGSIDDNPLTLTDNLKVEVLDHHMLYKNNTDMLGTTLELASGMGTISLISPETDRLLRDCLSGKFKSPS